MKIITFQKKILLKNVAYIFINNIKNPTTDLLWGKRENDARNIKMNVFTRLVQASFSQRDK